LIVAQPSALRTAGRSGLADRGIAHAITGYRSAMSEVTQLAPEPTAPTVRTRDLRGVHVVVTGASSGLGAAVRDALLACGACVTNLDRRPPDGDRSSWCDVDLSDTRAAESVVRDIAASRGVDAVVTAAGIDHPGALLDVDASRWERIVAVNLLATAAVIRGALPSLIERRGRVVTIASTLGHRAVSDATAYCASKWGVVGFTRALTAELKGVVGVTLVTPGGMDTAFFADRDEQYRPGPDAVLADPRDVADAVVYALSRPAGIELREMVVASPVETSWP
jgi:NAD(P)-dependent dehydrogenase (short-subunit alcohol dehydrogenase family)